MSVQRRRCTCHDLSEADFRSARDAGAATVKACFRSVGRVPRCKDCIPMVRRILAEGDDREPEPVACA